MFRSAGAALLRSGTSAVRNATTAAAKKAPAAKEGTRGNTEALMRTYVVSRELSEFLGKSETTRSEATSKVWEYIRNHNLQNPSKKSEYLPDATLKKILPADVITFTEISKLLSSHFPKAAPKAPKAPKVPKAPKEKKGAKVNDTD